MSQRSVSDLSCVSQEESLPSVPAEDDGDVIVPSTPDFGMYSSDAESLILTPMSEPWLQERVNSRIARAAQTINNKRPAPTPNASPVPNIRRLRLNSSQSQASQVICTDMSC
jgi:hypothetical protein